MDKFITVSEAVAKIKDGATVMVGGFLGVGSPLRLLDALSASNVKNLSLICNDTAYPDKGIGKLIANKQVKKLYVSH
ncbi:MAG: CoA-transferase, partial [Bacteroidales bacterium]